MVKRRERETNGKRIGVREKNGKVKAGKLRKRGEARKRGKVKIVKKGEAKLEMLKVNG